MSTLSWKQTDASLDAPTKGKRLAPGKGVSPLTYVALGVMTFLSAFPFYWMYIVASNTSEEVSKIPPSMVPGPNFGKVVQDVLAVIPFGVIPRHVVDQLKGGLAGGLHAEGDHVFVF